MRVCSVDDSGVTFVPHKLSIQRDFANRNRLMEIIHIHLDVKADQVVSG